MLSIVGAASLLAATAFAESTPDAEPTFEAATPFHQGAVGIGARASRWYGEEVAMGVGGHLRITPWERVGLELFWDSFMRPEPEQDTLWHSHVIGFHVMVPLTEGPTRIGPTFGACTAVEALTPLSGDLPSVADLRFAPHAGVFLDHAVNERWTLGGRATAYAYVGNAPHLDGWSAQTSNSLHVDPTLQVTAAVTRWF